MTRPYFWAHARQLITPTRLLAMALLVFALFYNLQHLRALVVVGV